MIAVLVPATAAPAATGACPSSIPDSGFRDLAGLSNEAVDAVACITYYGIAAGATSSRFDPYATVPRWQMALFLTRAARNLGITLPSGADQGFNDLAGLSTQAQQAINQLAQLGIARGLDTRTFAPYDTTPRWQMALFLTRLYAKAGLTLPNGSSQTFGDIATFPTSTQEAINQLAQLGIARGITSTRFDPNGIVERWQMALFLSRELDAARVRPFIVTLSPASGASPVTGKLDLSIRVTRSDGSPVGGRLVDVFVGSLDNARRCILDTDASIGSGDAGTGTDCRIDSNDPKTNSSGLVTVTLSHSSTQELDTVYAWVGESGQTFDADDVLGYGTAQVQWTAPVAKLRVGDSTARYGTQTKVSARLLTASDLPVALAGQRIVFRVTRNGKQIISQAIPTGNDGVATLTYMGPSDPSVNDDPSMDDTVTAFWDRDGDGVDDGAAEFDDTATVTWDDALPRADTYALTQVAPSSLVGEQVVLRVVVTDKFGVGYSGVKVTFVVSGANTATKTAITNSSGVAQVNYQGAVSGIDTIDASIDFDGDGTVDPEDLDFGSVADVIHRVVKQAPSLTDSAHTFDVIAFDAAKNTIDVVEIGTGNLYRLVYDTSNDLFSVDGKARTLDQFESALGALSLPALDGNGGVEITTDTYTTTQSGSSTFVLETS